MAATIKVVIAPGNGCTPIRECNFYKSVSRTLSTQHQIPCELREFPDPFEAKEKIWVPFLLEELKVDEHTILVGHSSGAEAAMRLAERNPVGALVLISPCVTDLNLESERISGYYDRPWDWQAIKRNCPRLVQFGSPNDPLVPFSEQNEVHKGLDTKFHVLQRRGHFMDSKFPELVQEIQRIHAEISGQNEVEMAETSSWAEQSCGAPRVVPVSPTPGLATPHACQKPAGAPAMEEE